MLVTLSVVGGVATVAALVALLVLGRRWRRGGVARALALAVPAAVVTGEAVARTWHLPSDQVVAAEAALVAAALLVGLARRAWNPVGVWFVASLAVAELSYLACAAQVTVAGGLGAGAMVMSFLLLLLEAAGLGLAASFAVETCEAVCRTYWDRPEAPPLPLVPYRPMVSVHVAAYNEPPDMLIETIRSLEALDYPALEIVVVDNNTEDPDVWKPVEEYCAGRPWVRYVHVAPWPGYKAGALNLALDELTDPNAELIAVVDADYLVDPSWLEDLVGWFADPRVAFVQGPQDYDEWEGDAYLTACHDSYAYFFTASMRVRDERNSAIFGGTMGLIRRSALEDVGGWDEWCITEDAELSLRLYTAGYHGRYVHRSYGRGIMPLTFSALKRQRFRWCFGGIQILRRHARRLLPWFRDPDDHLTTAQRLDFLLGGLQWGTDLVALGYTLVLAAALVTVLDGGHIGFRPLGGPTVVVPVALALAGAVRAIWALRVLEGISLRRAMLAFGVWLALSFTVARAVGRGIVRGDGVFLRTPKWRHEGGLLEAMRATRGETAVAAALAAGALVAAAHRQPLLVALAVWQSITYASAPAMAWLNLHTDLTARQQRRGRSEERRASYGTQLARVATAFVVLGCGGFVWLVAHIPGNAEPLQLPQRGEDDAGPLGNIGLAPGPATPATPTEAVPATPVTTAVPGTDAGDAGAGGATGTSPATTAPQASPSTSAASTTTTTAPGNGNGNGNGRPVDPTTPSHPAPGGPPTSL
jgi:glycosyltransferase involved in cell wall biosynthesis